MALVVKDRVKETSTSTGTGNFTLAGAVDGFQSFSAALANGDTTYYAITDAGTGAFEVGLGTYNAGVLTRTTILESTNAGAAVNFGAGEKEVFITYPAEKAVYADASGNISVPGLVDGRDLAADGSKLDGIEAGATADQTGAEIKSLYEAQANTNAYTDAEKSKLAGIEAGATADQTASEIKTAYESNANTNAFTDAEQSKLAGIEAGADVTDTVNVTAAGALMDSEVTNLAAVKAFDPTDYATAAQGALADSALQSSDIGVSVQGYNANTVIDAAYVHTDNNYTTAEKSKLAGIEAGATADQTASEILTAIKTVDGAASGLDADLLDGQDGSYYTGYTDTAAAAKVSKTGDTMTGNLSFGDNDKAIFGAGSDLQIYHDGSNSHFVENGTGNLVIRGTNISFANSAWTENYATFTENGAVTLHYDNAAKLATTSTGVNVTGSITLSGTVDGRDIAADGTKLDGIEAGATADQTKADIDALGINAATLGGNTAAYFTGYTDTAVANLVDAAPGTLDTLNELAAALGDDPNFATTVTNNIATKVAKSGDTMTGALNFGDNVKAQFGASADLQIYHDGANSYVKDAGTGVLNVQGSSQVNIGGANGTIGVQFVEGANVTLRHNNSPKLTTTSTGVDVTGNITLSGTVDGRDVAADGAKLDGIEAGATADQTITAGAGLTGGGTGDVTISHADTSAQASVNNSAGTVIQDVTLDTYGHVTGLVSYNLDGRYYTESEADSRFFNITGDTVTGDAYFNATSFWRVSAADTAAQRADARDDATNFSRLHWYGISDAGGTSNFRHAWYDGAAYINVTANSSGRLDFTGSAASMYIGGDRVFDDGYHPNADKLTTARNIALTGAVTGNANFDGSGNISIATTATSDPTLTINGDASGSATFTNLGNATLTLTIANDSHTHDGRYYTETEADSRFVNVAGDTLTGTLNYRLLQNQTTADYDTAGDNSGFSVFYGTSSATSKPAGTDHAVTTLSYSSAWQVQEAADWRTNARYIRKQENGTWSAWQRIFADDYHPNADKWTTARTLSLSGDASGSVSWDGSANATLSVTVADDSHNHVWGNIDGASVGSLAGPRFTTASGYIEFGPANTTWAHIYTDRPNFYFNKNLYVLGSKVWHAGNDGSGSGLDADLLDGLQSTQFLRSDTSDTLTSGVLTITGATNSEGALDIVNGRLKVGRHTSGSGIWYNGAGVDQTWFTGLASDSSTSSYRWWFSGDKLTLDTSGNLTATGNVTAYSDERLKSNIKTIDNALDKVQNLRGVTYDKDGKAGLGVIAQEVQKVLPEVVQEGEEYLSVAYGNIVGVLIEAIKEQQKQIDELKAKIK